jgi:hypothetical protein
VRTTTVKKKNEKSNENDIFQKKQMKKETFRTHNFSHTVTFCFKCKGIERYKVG